MSQQSQAWYRHTCAWLEGIDPSLAGMFQRAMRRAGRERIGEASAFEAILADFLAGYDLMRPSLRSEQPTSEPEAKDL